MSHSAIAELRSDVATIRETMGLELQRSLGQLARKYRHESTGLNAPSRNLGQISQTAPTALEIDL
jgi:hypothetical protein